MAIGIVSQEQIEALSAVVDRLDARGLGDEGQVLREILSQLTGALPEVPASTAANSSGRSGIS